jgi:hypothetical protein
VPKLKFSTLLQLLPFTAFFFAIQALAQFEVAPDHFDEDAAKPPAQLARTKVNQRKVFSSFLDGAQGRSQRRAASASASQRAVPSSPSPGVPSAKVLPSSAVMTSRRKRTAALRPAAGSVP